MRRVPTWGGAEAQVRGAAATAAACSLSAPVTEGQAPRGCFSRLPAVGVGGNGTLCRTAEGPKSRPPLRAAMPGPDPKVGVPLLTTRAKRGASCALRERSGAARREAHLSLRASRRPCHGVTAPPRLTSPMSWRHGAPAPPVAHVMASRRLRASRRPCHSVTATPPEARHGAVGECRPLSERLSPTFVSFVAHFCFICRPLFREALGRPSLHPRGEG